MGPVLSQSPPIKAGHIECCRIYFSQSQNVFVQIENSSVQIENVVFQIHNASKAFQWIQSYPTHSPFKSRS